MKRILFLLAFFFALPIAAQQSQYTAQSFNVQPLNAIAAPTGVSAVSDFENGNTTRYYWVIAHNGGQTSVPVSTVDTKGPVTLSASIGSRVLISWTLTSNTTFDVLESSTATLPNSSTCGCAVITGSANGSVYDTGVYSAYSTLPLLGFNFQFTNVLDNGVPEVLATYQNQSSALCIFTSGVLSCGGGGSPACSFTAAILFNGGCNQNFTYTNATSLFSQLTPTPVFASGQMNLYHESLLGGINPATEFASQQGGLADTEAITGGTTCPSGSTIHQCTAVVGYATNGAGGSGGTTNAVGGYFQCRSIVMNGYCWGINPLVSSTAGQPTGLIGAESDVNPTNTTDGSPNSAAYLADGIFAVQPQVDSTWGSGGKLPAFRTLSGSLTNGWTTGYVCEQHSLATATGVCFLATPHDISVPNQPSWNSGWCATNSSSVVSCGAVAEFPDGVKPFLKIFGSGVEVGQATTVANASPCNSSASPSTFGILDTFTDSITNNIGSPVSGGGNNQVLAYCDAQNNVYRVIGGSGSVANVNGGSTTSPGTCPTTGTAYAQCSVTVPLQFTEPNTDYFATCSVQAGGSTGNPWVYQISKGVSSIVVTISNLSGALATASTPGETDCVVTGT